jgi:hypothetical protein
MTLSNYSIAFNGLTIGAGTNYQILNIDGLGGTAPLRIQDDNRGYVDGSYSGHDFYDERTVYIDVLVIGDNSTNAQANYKALQSAFAPQQLGFYIDPSGTTPAASQLKLFQFRLTSDTGDKRMYGRSRGLTTSLDPDFSYGYIKTRIAMTFPDPRYYDDSASTGTGTSVSVANTGWAISCPVITISSVTATSGDVTDGTLGSTTDGYTHMTFSGLTSGQSLIIDTLQRIIYSNTGSGYIANRGLLTPAFTGWLSLAAGSSATWKSNIGTMSISYRNAYI